MIYQRTLKPQLEEAMKHFPVVLLTGARQVGKSTLAQQLLDNYITLDDINIYSAMQADAQTFIETLKKPIAIDEIQKLPELLLPIKLTVDRNRKNGSFLLTGSANIMACKQVTDTLAGRIALLELMPLSCREIAGSSINLLDSLFNADLASFTSKVHSAEQIITKVISGGYPEIQRIDSARGRYQWFSAYIQTYIQRDVRDLSDLRQVEKFLKMYRLLASRSGNLLNKADVARDAAINIKTFDNYFELLKLVYQVGLLPAYSTNIDKRLIKASKLFFTDSGLLAHLLNINSEKEFYASPYRGGLFETFIYGELLKAVKYDEKGSRLYYLRTADNQEVDFIIERGSDIVALEVKMAGTVHKADFKHLKMLQTKVNTMRAGYIIYLGDRALPFGKDLYALPAGYLC
jgi:uncharacterized protein